MGFWPVKDIVPVLTFHSVGMNEPSWIWRQLSERADAFECLLRKLRTNGYHTVSLSELYAHMKGEQRCKPKSIVLVFDDGYLDNWVTVGPLLRKYGMTGAVYVNPDFVEPGDELRPNLDDYRNIGSDSSEISQTGFMNWSELKHLDESGVLDVQSHSLTHTWHFKSSEIIDFYTPSSAHAYPWMAWNAKPERKPYYLTEDQAQFVPWGTPIFEHEKSLLARRFLPDLRAITDLVDAIAKLGGPEVLERPDYQVRLQNLVDAETGGKPFPGSYESDSQYESRIRFELQQSKSLIESNLNKTVDFLCWPGGGTNAVAKRLAGEVGYKSWTLPSNEERDKRNQPGADPQQIKRLPAIRDVLFFGRKWGTGSERLVYLEMLAHQESRAFDLMRKVYKLGVAFGIAGQRRAA